MFVGPKPDSLEARAQNLSWNTLGDEGRVRKRDHMSKPQKIPRTLHSVMLFLLQRGGYLREIGVICEITRKCSTWYFKS